MVAKGERWEQAIDAEIADARAQEYVFWSRRGDDALARFKSTNTVERLVDGVWVSILKPYAFAKWQRLSDAHLRAHSQAYLVNGFGSGRAEGLGLWGRLRRRGILRWMRPPLDGGATRGLDAGLIDRIRDHRTRELGSADSGALAALREEALLGHQTLAERCALLEQRANFFLGAAGLTSSLVLANAGLLLGTGKLDEPWLCLAAVSLGGASVCAVVAGLVAMQAAMSTFVRTTPNGVTQVSRRAALGEHSQTRAYVASLFVAQNREEVVGDWKLKRLKAARSWFLATIAGILVLTTTVLLEAAGL